MTEMLVQDSKATAFLARVITLATAFYNEQIRAKVPGLFAVPAGRIRFLWGFPTRHAVEADGARPWEVRKPSKDVKVLALQDRPDVLYLNSKTGSAQTVNITSDGTWLGILSPLKFTANHKRFTKKHEADAVTTGDVFVNVLRCLIHVGTGDGVETLTEKSPTTIALREAGWNFPPVVNAFGVPVQGENGPKTDFVNFTPPGELLVAMKHIVKELGPLPAQIVIDALQLKKLQPPNALIKMTLHYKGDTFAVRLTGAEAKRLNAHFGKADTLDGVKVERTASENMSDAEATAIASAEKGRGGARIGAGRKSKPKPQAAPDAQTVQPDAK